MSETTTAPTAPEAASAPASAPAAPQQPTTAAEARAAARSPISVPAPTETSVQAGEAPAAAGQPASTPDDSAVDARGRLHGPDGKFLPKDQAATTPNDSTAPAAAEPTSATPEPTAEKSPTAEEWVKIEVPGFREMGFEAIHARPGEERAIRALVNGYARRGEVEEARTYANQVQEYAISLQAERDAYWELLQTALTDPTLGDEVRQISELLGPEAAQRHLAGLLGQTTEKVQERANTLRQQAETQRIEQRALEFSQQAMAAARKMYPLWGDADIQRALGQYATWLEMTRGSEYSLKDFFDQANLLYIQNPRVMEEARRRQSAEAERIRKETMAAQAEEERKRIEEAAARRATNPWAATPPSALRTGVTVPPDEGGPVTAEQARRSLRVRA